MLRGTWLALVAATVLLAACGTPVESEPEIPAQVVPVAGTTLKQVRLTPLAVQRIALQTATVQRLPAGSAATESVPLSAVLYLSDGTMWVYVVAGTMTYQRASVTIVSTTGDTAMLLAGPPPGTQVVTVGAAELLGSEYGVAGGQ